MSTTIYQDIVEFTKNQQDGQAIATYAKVAGQKVQEIIEQIIPAYISAVTNKPKTANSLLEVYAKNTTNPSSLTNVQAGFDSTQAQREGYQVLNAIFGGEQQTQQVAEKIAEKISVKPIQVETVLPMLAALFVRFLGKQVADNVGASNVQGQGDQLQSLLSGYISNTKQKNSILNEIAKMGQQFANRVFGDQQM